MTAISIWSWAADHALVLALVLAGVIVIVAAVIAGASQADGEGM